MKRDSNHDGEFVYSNSEDVIQGMVVDPKTLTREQLLEALEWSYVIRDDELNSQAQHTARLQQRQAQLWEMKAQKQAADGQVVLKES